MFSRCKKDFKKKISPVSLKQQNADHNSSFDFEPSVNIWISAIKSEGFNYCIPFYNNVMHTLRFF